MLVLPPFFFDSSTREVVDVWRSAMTTAVSQVSTRLAVSAQAVCVTVGVAGKDPGKDQIDHIDHDDLGH